MKSTDLAEVRRTLWAAADKLRANSRLAPSEYRGPVLGLIFLAYAEYRFEEVRPALEAKATARRPVTPDDYRARGVLFISEEARATPPQTRMHSRRTRSAVVLLIAFMWAMASMAKLTYPRGLVSEVRERLESEEDDQEVPDWRRLARSREGWTRIAHSAWPSGGWRRCCSAPA